MKKLKRPASQSEAMKLRWKRRIVFEKRIHRVVRRMDGGTPGSVIGSHAIWTCGSGLPKTEREFPTGESDTALLRSGVP